jgi:hypothetical protein
MLNRKVTSAGIIVVAVLVILSIPFIPKEIIEQYGSAVFLAPIVVIIVALFIAILLINKKTHADLLQEERQKALVELKEAERQFLQRKIDKPTFDSITKEKNANLIKVEAGLDSLKKSNLPKEDLKKADTVSSDKHKLLFQLLNQKQLKVHELKLAETSYLKRKIDEQAFQKISSDIKKEIISLESQIKALQETEEISKIKEQLKESAKELGKQKKISSERGKQDFMEELEEDIFEQANEAS